MSNSTDFKIPSLTKSEAFLTESSKEELYGMAGKLLGQGPEKVVITGILQGDFIASYAVEKGKEPKMIQVHKAGTERSGTAKTAEYYFFIFPHIKFAKFLFHFFHGRFPLQP